MNSTGQISWTGRFDPKLMAGLGGLDLKARYVMEGFLSGLHDSPFHGFSVEFSDYRDYQAGDDLRHVDWRLYARSDRLCIKRYMQETNARCYVICDTSASMQYRGRSAWGSKLECARVLAAALTWFLLKQNDATGMVALNGATEVPEFIRPSQRPSQLGLMLRHLEGLEPTRKTCLAQLLDQAARLIHRRSMVLLFSDLLEDAEEVGVGLKHLRFLGHEVIVFQVLDSDEIDFPFREPRIFEDLETGVRRVVSPDAVREQYIARFQAFMSSYSSLFQSLEIPHCIVRTDANPWQALALFLAERKRRF